MLCFFRGISNVTTFETLTFHRWRMVANALFSKELLYRLQLSKREDYETS